MGTPKAGKVRVGRARPNPRRLPALRLGCLTCTLPLVAASAPDRQALTEPADTVHYLQLRDTTRLARTSASTDRSGIITIHTRFYPDTGRRLVTRLRLDHHQATPVWLETRGLDAAGRPVDESFRIGGGLAVWRVDSDSGRKRSEPGAIYLPAIHARWQAILPRLVRVEGPAAFLPRGTARLEREASFVVRCLGVAQPVTQYAAYGLTPLLPDRVWVDTSGQLFAAAETVREGCEDALPILHDSAAAARAATHLRFARTLRRIPAKPVAIRNARVFNADSRTVTDRLTVLVQDTLIVAVGRDGTVPLATNTEVIDARGRMLLPGLWDMHSHDYGDVPGEMAQLAGGVTTIRDMLRDTLLALRIASRPQDEVAFAPHVFWAGGLDGLGGRRGVVTSDSAVRFLVRRYAALGAKQIKLYGRLHPELVPTAVEEARRLGLRVGGHLAAGMSVEQAVAAGYQEISHLPFLFARIDSAYLGSALWRGVQNAASLDLDGDAVQRLIALLREHGVAVDANLAFVEPSLRTDTLVVRRDVAPVLDRLSAAWGQTLVGWDMVSPHDSLVPTAVAGFAGLKRFVRMLHEAGVPVLPGTDFLGGFTLHRELELYAEAGIPAADVLYLATLGAARLMGVDARVGSIVAGKRADLILVDGDPLRDMRDIRRVVMTMKSGALYDPAVLYQTLSFGACCLDRR